MLSVRLPGFLPSRNGFLFDNNALAPGSQQVTLPGGSVLQVQEVTRGLSGGMCFAAADYWQVGLPAPNHSVPQVGSPLYQYLLDRQVDNLDPNMLLLAVTSMNPYTPAASLGDLYTQQWGVSRAAIMLQVSLPLCMRDLQLGVPSQLTILEATSIDIRSLGQHNRQVLCYGYDTDPGWVTLWLYDPSLPGRDDIRMQLPTLLLPNLPIYPSYTDGAATPQCFFRVPYSPKAPPVA